MTEQELLLFGIKQYIERFMYDGSKYHLSTQDIWVKQLYNIIQEQQKEIEMLEKQMENALFVDSGYKPKPHRTFEID